MTASPGRPPAPRAPHHGAPRRAVRRGQLERRGDRHRPGRPAHGLDPVGLERLGGVGGQDAGGAGESCTWPADPGPEHRHYRLDLFLGRGALHENEHASPASATWTAPPWIVGFGCSVIGPWTPRHCTADPPGPPWGKTTSSAPVLRQPAGHAGLPQMLRHGQRPRQPLPPLRRRHRAGGGHGHGPGLPGLRGHPGGHHGGRREPGPVPGLRRSLGGPAQLRTDRRRPGRAGRGAGRAARGRAAGTGPDRGRPLPALPAVRQTDEPHQLRARSPGWFWMSARTTGCGSTGTS